MDPKDTVLALYRAYATRDPQAIEALLHDEVVWVAPPGNATQVALGLGRGDDAGAPSGSNDLHRDRIVDFMVHHLGRLFTGIENRVSCLVAEGPQVFIEHRLSATLPDGRRYVNDYCFGFEVHEGRVRRIREYMDTRGGWVQLFGDGPGRVLAAP